MKNFPRRYSLLPIVVAFAHCVFMSTTMSKTVHSLQIPSTPKIVVQRSVTTRGVVNESNHCFLPKQMRQHQSSLSASGAEPSSTTSVSLPTLSSDTTWMVRITLRNIKSQQGQTISNQMYVINGQFLPEENYEPPQGTFVSTDRNIESDSSSSSSSNMQIASSRWILSEDPNDRRDGLWIWGLFQQPLYPYLLLSVETKPIEIKSSSDSLDYIPALQLYVQLDHNCNRDTGAVSFVKSRSASDGSNYELMIRQKEIIAADPLSLSKVEIYEEVSIGTVSIQPKL